jgi:homoserine dehydrogenase
VNADSLGRVSPFSFRELKETTPLPIERQKRPWYLRFRVQDRPGILAALCGVLADHGISIDAVLQLPEEDKKNLPFVITTEASVENAVRDSVEKMAGLDFMAESPLAMPIESGL